MNFWLLLGALICVALFASVTAYVRHDERRGLATDITLVFTGTGAELFDFGLLPISFSTSTTLAVEFYAWGAQSNIGSTAKPYFPTTDRLNVPRLTYQNGGGGCPSLLLEKQSTNVNENSNNFVLGTTQTYDWYDFNNKTPVANQGTSPDGTNNA